MNEVKKHKVPAMQVIQLTATIFLLLAGTVLVYCAMFIPPAGEIHPTVLAAYGMMLTFVGSVIGVDYNYRWKEFSFFPSFGKKKSDDDEDKNGMIQSNSIRNEN